MPNYKLLIEYDGTNFSGWQVQPNARTVQGELEDALLTLLKRNTRLTAAGRTDSGVHAREQVANFASEEEIPDLGKFRNSLNGITAEDVVIQDILPVADGFHARYYAKARQYAYQITTRPLSIARQYAYFCHFALDLEMMREASALLKGQHNFEAFTQRDPEEKHYLCHIEEIEWIVDEKRIIFRIRANRFLRNMVRRIVGALVELGRGRIALQDFQDMLERQEKQYMSVTAPAKGLFLEKVFY
jgi:tRNA pseudouridine38-40 synthase